MRLFRITLLFLIFLAETAQGQRSDSLSCDYDHTFAWRQTIAPTALLTTGSVIAFSSLHHHWNEQIRDWSQSDGHQSCPADDYIQYVPGASVLLLKACGLESKHNWRDLANLGGGSAILGFGLTQGLKHTIRFERPYGGTYTSFPSGHTFTAFVGAEILRREYGEEYPGIAVAGYAVATGVGAMRIYNNKHWCSDVIAGAGIGILSASIMYWLAPYLRF